jgi:site-specific DNA recombinase
MRAIIYIRVSTHEQKELGFSLQSQQQMCMLKAKQLGISKKLIFSDSLSGRMNIYDRPGLSDALLALKKNDVFIVSHRDRLARDIKVMADIQETIQNTKAKLVFIVEEQDLESKRNSLLRSTIADILAEAEALDIRAKTRNALHVLKSQNRCVGNVPFGYQRSADGKLIEPCLKEQAIIKMAQKLNKDSCSPSQITKKINARGHTSRMGKPFQLAQIQRIIKACNLQTVGE